MAFERMDEKEAVKRAALLEKNGYRFYTLLQDKTDNKEVRKVFKGLAKDELRHLKIFEKRFFPEAGFSPDQITEEELAIELNLERSGSSDIFTKKIDVDALVRSIKDTRGALITALYTERHSVEYFEEMAKNTEALEGTRLYAELAGEERRHVAEIEALLAKVE
ncbi:MAG: ferritin family protein [Deltaproteobacteria bacterium]|nr:ferritin family protein [Deltaproteobacteria bacterium]